VPTAVASNANVAQVDTLHATMPWINPSARRGPPHKRPATQAPTQIEIRPLTRSQMPEAIATFWPECGSRNGSSEAMPTAAPSNVNMIWTTIVTKKPAKIAPHETLRDSEGGVSSAFSTWTSFINVLLLPFRFLRPFSWSLKTTPIQKKLRWGLCLPDPQGAVPTKKRKNFKFSSQPPKTLPR
jgi:hypothetical protein